MSAPDDDQWGPPPLSVRDSRFSAARATRPWNWRLGVFLRAMSAIELVKGLVHWALLIGAGGSVDPVQGHEVGWFVSTGVFAVMDPVAAVGLWVGAAWGVAIWLIATIAQIAVSGLGGPTAGGWAIIAVALMAMTTYVWLSMKARKEAT